MLRILTLGFLVFGATVLRAQQPPTASATSVSLRPGDLVQVEIWREEDLSGEFPVDESGTVVLPLIGPRHVTSMPIAEMRDSLLAAYRRELRNPSIVITPLRRIYVLGEVNEPGLQSVDPTVSLAGAIALAGGANAQGDLRRIQIYREGQRVVGGVTATSMLAALDIRSGDQIFVGRRSWFERNSSFVISALLSITGIIITLAQ